MRFTSLLLLSLLYLPSFSQSTFSPENVLGYKIGTQFTPHDKVVDYFTTLEKAYPKQVRIDNYGKSNEQRQLYVAIIASEENLARLEEIRLNHLNGVPTENSAIVWLSYNVHGNESCGTEAAMQTAYELLSKKTELLQNTIVIIDPCLNPDGRERYVNYYRQYGPKINNPNRSSAEHNEPWHSGRSNHYLFDLNRDWAWLTQVESKQRIQLYNQWLPHVHVDFHEQSINEPYFFPPAAEPYHEVITPWQRKFQIEIGKNHAKHFDQAGWLYFSKETFDLLYPSYGDTYPTFNGAIGMTYEQGGSGRAGLSVFTNTDDTLTLCDRVLHHVTTGISTLEVSANMSKKLVEEYRDFVKNKNYYFKSFVLDGKSPNLNALLKLMDLHGIIYKSTVPMTAIKGFDYFSAKEGTYKTKEGDIVISTNQLKGTLVNVLFEPNTKLKDSLTYDLSAWSLPYAYGISTLASTKLIDGTSYNRKPITEVLINKDNYAYLCRWDNLNSARFLTQLLEANIKVSFSESNFESDGASYKKGTLIILRGENNIPEFDKLLAKIALKTEVEIFSIASGMVDKGFDLGSSKVKNIPNPKIGILAGKMTSSLSVGENWHFFEEEMNKSVSLILEDEIDEALNDLNVLIVPEGDYTPTSSLNDWVANGGKLIVIGNAINAFMNDEFYNIKEKELQVDSLIDHDSYENSERNDISHTINGAIYACELDESNPLCFGLGASYFTLRTSPNYYTLTDGTTIKIKKENALIAGFAGNHVKSQQANALIAGVEGKEDGCVIYFIDNPMFRGFWENGKLLMLNAIYFMNQQ